MLRRLRSRLTYANVMSTIAVFVALATGTAYAANTVFSTDIVDGQVKSVDVGNGEILSADVKDQSLTTFDVSTFLGADVVDNTLTGADVDESTLRLGATDVLQVNSLPFTAPPVFSTAGFCYWDNFNYPAYSKAMVTRDSAGYVHLQGVVSGSDGGTGSATCEGTGASTIYTLPPGYRPLSAGVFPSLANYHAGRITVHPAGNVAFETPTTAADARVWVTLDGISFRCWPSGQDGCP